MMKLLISALFVLTFVSVGSSQKVERVKNKKLNQVLLNLSDKRDFSFDDYQVSVFYISNPSGSAHVPETDEITNDVIVTLIEIGEGSKHGAVGKVYKFHNLYLPEVTPIETKSTYIRFRLKYCCDSYGSPVEKFYNLKTGN